MTDALLPPDPSKDGWYWLTRGSAIYEVWRWLPSQRSWYSKNTAGSIILYAETMAQGGHTLASPYPIPGPEQLDVLHALPAAMRKEAVTNWSARSQHDHVTAAVGQAAVCAAMLRAALGSKPSPNDPPGNSLDDVRATAMDQWGIPRAGEEAAP